MQEMTTANVSDDSFKHDESYQKEFDDQLK